MLKKYQTSTIRTANRQQGIVAQLANQYDIGCLYHMTHISNLVSILESGLLSHNLAHSKYHLRDISDQDVNARRIEIEPIYKRSMHDYVPTYFAAKNPMSYKRREISDDLVILKINPALLLQAGTLFTDGNAASSYTHFYREIEDLKQLNWDCLHCDYWPDYPDGRRIRCAEMLIPDRIEMSDITAIAVNRKKSLKKIEQIAMPFVPVSVQKELFFRTH